MIFAQRYSAAAERTVALSEPVFVEDSIYHRTAREWFTLCRDCGRVQGHPDRDAALADDEAHTCTQRTPIPRHYWSNAEDRIVACLTAHEAARELPHRTMAAIQLRRRTLHLRGIPVIDYQPKRKART